MGEFFNHVNKVCDDSFTIVEGKFKDEIKNSILEQAARGSRYIELRWYREKSYGFIKDDMINRTLVYLKSEGFCADLNYKTTEKIHFNISW